MVFRITFKSPDGVSHSIEGLEKDERSVALDFISSWVEFEEYITVEFNTENKTAKVIKIR